MTMTMETETGFNWGEIVQLGLLAAIIASALSLIGMVGTFAGRDIIGGMVQEAAAVRDGLAFQPH